MFVVFDGRNVVPEVLEGGTLLGLICLSLSGRSKDLGKILNDDSNQCYNFECLCWGPC